MTWDYEDEERFERAMEDLGRMQDRYEAEVLDNLAADQEDDGRISPDGPIRPLYWHPWYRDRTNLLDWLNANDRDRTLCVPLPMSRHAFFRNIGDETLPEPVKRDYLVLTKQHAAAPAPYVGEPFCYSWYIATDQHGRSIASEAQIVYLPGA